jgi:hypothetical protein
MRVYSVSYDLRVKTNPKYKALAEELQRSAGWFHLLESTWLVATNETARELWLRLASNLHSTDFIFVAEVKKTNYSGWLVPAAWKWIQEVFPAYAAA